MTDKKDVETDAGVPEAREEVPEQPAPPEVPAYVPPPVTSAPGAPVGWDTPLERFKFEHVKMITKADPLEGKLPTYGARIIVYHFSNRVGGRNVVYVGWATNVDYFHKETWLKGGGAWIKGMDWDGTLSYSEPIPEDQAEGYATYLYNRMAEQHLNVSGSPVDYELAFDYSDLGIP